METLCGGWRGVGGWVGLKQGPGHSCGELKCRANARDRGTKSTNLAKALCDS